MPAASYSCAAGRLPAAGAPLHGGTGGAQSYLSVQAGLHQFESARNLSWGRDDIPGEGGHSELAMVLCAPTVARRGFLENMSGYISPLDVLNWCSYSSKVCYFAFFL